jgi:Zn-dependent peptidase ImmA (M78 family)
MNAQNNKSVTWQHPIPNLLLCNYRGEIGILDILELETESLLDKIRKNDPKIFTRGEVSTPIEKIAHALNIELTNCSHSKALGTSSVDGSKIQVAINSQNQHYFRQRFTIAHELGHICLSQLAGPLTYREIAQTEKSNYEEEFLCDLFASALLMPSSAIEQYLGSEADITWNKIIQIAKDFKVSKSAVLRRVAWVRKSLLLFWSEIENPLTKGSEKAERVTFVYPNISQLSKYYIPLFCTASDERFKPNLIVDSLKNEASISGRVLIKNLGSLPEANYDIHNIFYKRWSKDTFYPEYFNSRKRLYDMFTFIELKDCG